jgi:RimJ/RimL family protein N-acetyltransferase
MRLALRNCTVRSWRTDDLESLVTHADNRNVWINLRDRFPHPYSRADGRAWLETACRQDPETNFAIDVAGRAVGGIGFILQHDIAFRSAEIGYWLGEAFWGRGISTEAVRAVTAYAIDKYDLCRVFAAVFEWNPGSCRVLEKAGYVREARMRKSATKAAQTVDEFLYAFVTE